MLKGVTPIGKEIGRGAYGRVFEVIYCGSNYAAKEIHPVLLQFARESEAKEMKNGFLLECYLLSKCLHPKIVQFIGIYYQPAVIPTMVMELMDCSLTAFVKRNRSIPLHGALSVLQDVSLGVLCGIFIAVILL